MIIAEVKNNKTKLKCEGTILEITAEGIELVVHLIEEMVAGQDNTIKRMHVDMFCDVLKSQLEETILNS